MAEHQGNDYVLASSDVQDATAAPDPTPEPAPVVPEKAPEPAPVVPELAPEPTPVSAEQRRLDAAFAAQRRRTEALEAELARLKATQQPRPDTPPGPPPRDPNAPKREWFQGDDEAYMQALAAYNAQRQMNGYVQHNAWNAQQSQWDTRMAQTRQAHPDYDRVIDALDVTFHPGILHALHQHPQGPELSYHLATHPEEAQQIAGLPPSQGLWELGRIAGSLPANGTNGTAAEAPARPQPPREPLPSPPQPVGPSQGSTSTLPPDEMDYDTQFRDWWKKGHNGSTW